MFNVLLESNRTWRLPSTGVVISASLHLAVAGLMAGGTAAKDVVPRAESFITRALFLPPADRVRSLAPTGERLQWLSLGIAAGGLAAFTDLPIGQSVQGRPTERNPNAGTDTGEDEQRSVFTPLVIGNDTAFSIMQVDKEVTRYADSESPLYPNDLLAKQVEGAVYLRYIVDTTGIADTSTAQVVRSSHELFTRAVMAALPRMKFRPATMGDRLVRQLVEQEFAFRIQKPGSGQVGPPAPATTP